jgi:hypothetical protein
MSCWIVMPAGRPAQQNATVQLRFAPAERGGRQETVLAAIHETGGEIRTVTSAGGRPLSEATGAVLFGSVVHGFSRRGRGCIFLAGDIRDGDSDAETLSVAHHGAGGRWLR